MLPKYFIIAGLPFCQEMIYNCFIPLIRDLAVAHKAGVFHRNIKSGNLVYSPYTNKLVLTDFGLAIRNREAIKSSYSSSITNLLLQRNYAVKNQMLPLMFTDLLPRFIIVLILTILIYLILMSLNLIWFRGDLVKFLKKH